MLRPDGFAKNLYEISHEDLLQRGCHAIIIDLDNTLVGYHQQRPSPEVAAWIDGALLKGFRIVVVSNNVEAWVREVASGLKISFLHKAAKPLPRSFAKALQLLGVERDKTIVIGDQLFTDVLGAKLCGLRVILTEPIVSQEHVAMRFLRFFERLFLMRRKR